MHGQSHGRSGFFVAWALLTVVLLWRELNVALQSYSFASFHKSKSNGIANSTLGFERIIAINTPSRTDRKDALTLAAAYTGLTPNYINGINASETDERAFPQGPWRRMPKGHVGGWRAHMDAVRMVVEHGLSTALIMEDNVDWDIKLRDQLRAFAVANRKLPKMIRDGEEQMQKEVPSTEDPNVKREVLDPREAARLSTRSISPKHRFSGKQDDEPYGSDWDVLWLGHCGSALPSPSYTSSASTAPVQDRLMYSPDVTLPAPSGLELEHAIHPFAQIYPAQTRVYHRSHQMRCTVAYAVTQQGARKILYEHGIRNLDKGFDLALSEWCDGETRNMGGPRPMCLTASPPIFRNTGSESDTTIDGAEEVERGSLHIVNSVKVSLDTVL